MKKLFIPVALIAVFASSLLTSCKKKDDDDTSRKGMIVGSWKTTEAGVDSNANGIWDAAERKPIAATDAETYTFNADGSGSGATSFGTIPFTWNLQNNDNDLRVITNFLGADTGILSIVSFTSTDAVTKDNSSNPVEYTALHKQ